MNVLFLTLLDFNSLQERNIYTDLLREFVKHNHNVCVISPVERRTNQKTHIIKEKNTTILKLRIGNIQKTNVIEKGISTISIEQMFTHAIKKYFIDVRFDLILYSTPPITFCNAIKFVKKRDDAITYLLLKDIFPQNAVDLGMMSKTGAKRLLYNFFRNKEKKLYEISDYIGCMSQANVKYILKHNPEIKPDIVEVCPNAIDIMDMRVDTMTRGKMRNKYGIPLDRKIFVYGGNLGKPQGITFLIDCLKLQINNSKVFFLIVGDGTEFTKLKKFFDEQKPTNMKLMKRLSKKDYDCLIAACDVGMIFLDHRFTIPNFPSRLLSYMQAGIPVLACTDINTDIGKVIVDGDFGWWCESNDSNTFSFVVKKIANEVCLEKGYRGWNYLCNHYNAEISYKIIINHMK